MAVIANKSLFERFLSLGACVPPIRRHIIAAQYGTAECALPPVGFVKEYPE
jgi:hypothetical protein